jgi:16S rRNA (guanine966-N2)-methyltransferase
MKHTQTAQPSAHLPHAVRIIGGQWRRRLLPVVAASNVRPTPARVRETLFNWLGQDLSGWRCLDAFAGTGALGLEAASRGAEQVLLIEKDKSLIAHLQRLCLQLNASQVQVQHADALFALAQQAPQHWDLILLDPPFTVPAYDTLVHNALRTAAQILQPQGFVYLEAPRLWQAADLSAEGWKIHRSSRAGAVFFHLLHR